MKRNAFLWSGAVIYFCLILLVLSIVQYGILGVLDESADTRASADRVYKIAYNVFFDFNLHLSREAGRAASQICERGGDPGDLTSCLDLQNWLRLTYSWLNEEGLSSNLSVSRVQFYRHREGDPRDLVQLSQLGLPKEYAYYAGSINLDAVLLISIRDVRTGVSRETEFHVRSLCPIRIFLLKDLSYSFVAQVTENLGTWIRGRDAQDLAENISRSIVDRAENFFWDIRQGLFRGRCEYHVWVSRIGGSLFEVSISLNLVELTDMGEFSFVVSDSKRTRISFRLRDIRTVFRCRLESPSDGPDSGECEGTVYS